MQRVSGCGDVGDGVVGQIEARELDQPNERIDRLNGAVAEIQAREIGQRTDDLQHGLRKRAAGQVERLKRRHLF